MKKMLIVSIILVFLLIPTTANAESKYIYDLFKSEAVEDGLAEEYTGDHRDSITKAPSQKIYYWHDGDTSDDKKVNNNIIFGGYCWQMVRTTDTGGIKMIYNGIPVDGKCLTDRANTFGYMSNYSDYRPTLTYNYWYGTDYTYNPSTKRYTLSGELTQKVWSSETASDIIGKYSCLSLSQTSTCSYLYLIESYYSETKAYAIHLGSTAYYYSIGSTKFNWEGDSLAEVGYMYNKEYPHTYGNSIIWGTYDSSTTPLLQDEYEVVSNSTVYPFVYDDNTNLWNGIVSEYDKTASITFKVKEAGDYKLFYVANGSYTSIKKNGTRLKRFHGYTNGKQSMDFTGLTTEDTITIEYEKSDTTINIYEGTSFSLNKSSSTPVDNRYSFGNDVTYSNGQYTLKDSIYAELNDDLKNNHYSCFSRNDKCETVYYIFRFRGAMPYYIELKNGEKVEDALNDMLYADDVNKKDSVAKTALDKWYEKYFTSYADYIEETVYCFKRIMTNFETSGWNPNGGDLSVDLRFMRDTDLSCENETDRYSISNPKAKLKYKIGFMSHPELKLASNSGVFYATNSFVIPTPFGIQTSSEVFESGAGGGNIWNVDTTRGNSLRPAISLKPWSTYSTGDGTKENPYIYDGIDPKYMITVQLVDETKDLNITIDDLTRVEEGDEVNFNVTPIKGYKIKSVAIHDENDNDIPYTQSENGYVFTMPNSDITIIPSYERVTNSVDVEDNINTKEIRIEVNDSTAVVYEDKVRFVLVPEDGYEVDTVEVVDINDNNIECTKTSNPNEYEFTMPDVDVTIKPSYKLVTRINIPNTSKNSNYIHSVITIILLIISSITMIYLNRKNN